MATVKSRREEYAEATRAGLVDAALARFTEDGFAGATLDSVASAARVTRGAVYHHFKDKTELFEAAFVLLEERLLKNVTEAVNRLADQSGPWMLFSAGLNAFLQESAEPDFRRVALQDAPSVLGWERWRGIKERYFLQLISQALSSLADAGEIDLPPGGLAARMLLAAISEAGLDLAASVDPVADRSAAIELITRLVHGLR